MARFTSAPVTRVCEQSAGPPLAREAVQILTVRRAHAEGRRAGALVLTQEAHTAKVGELQGGHGTAQQLRASAASQCALARPD